MTLIVLTFLTLLAITGFVTIFLQFNILVDENQQLGYKISQLAAKIESHDKLSDQLTKISLKINEPVVTNYSDTVMVYAPVVISALFCIGVFLYFGKGNPDLGKAVDSNFTLIDKKLNAILDVNEKVADVILKSELMSTTKASLVNTLVVNLQQTKVGVGGVLESEIVVPVLEKIHAAFL